MSSIAEDIRIKMMLVLKEEENKTDLENLAVLSRVGMKVASASSSDLDADATSASSTALIDLGLRLNSATRNGNLTEIILHNTEGYSILMAINDEYIVFGGLRATYRIGYYLGYLRELTKKLNILIFGDKDPEMMLSLQEPDIKKQEMEEESNTLIKPSVEQDKAALDGLLGFLDDWENKDLEFEELETVNDAGIVSIPKSIGLETEREIRKFTKFESEQPQKTPVPEPKSQFKVYSDEVPPIPIDDYTPMEIDDEPVSEESASVSEQSLPVEEFPPLEDLPSFDELAPPNFDAGISASEYDTEFVLEEESEALGSVLKDLGWDQEED